MKSAAFLITCEHAVADVPGPYRPLFDGRGEVLETHRGWDAGAWKLAGRLAMALGAPLLLGSCTRLLVDLNRAETHPDCFSEFSRELEEEQRLALLERYHRPFRHNAEDMVEIARARGQFVVHLSIHTFTPELNGEVRDADVGLLFDPAREAEARLCDIWKREMLGLAPELRVRFNYPYLGTDDGLTTALRQRFPGDVYAGIELELNHGPFIEDKERWDEMCDATVEGLIASAPGFAPPGTGCAPPAP